MKISILVPTRGRPLRVRTLLESIQHTSMRDVETILYFDDDDPTRETAQSIAAHFPTRWMIGERPEKLSASYNRLLALAEGGIIGYGADDVVMMLNGWDDLLRSTFERYRHIVLVSGGESAETPLHGFLSRQAIETLGYVFPPYFEHGYADYWVGDIYRRIQRYVYIPALLRHQHWHQDTRLYDATYEYRSVRRDVFGRLPDQRDKILYDCRAHERIEAAEKLQRRIEGK